MFFRRSNTPRKPSHKHRSFWLQEIAGDAPDAPALQGTIKTDVAIAGGGYVGLWTAIRIKKLMPACDVTVIEQDICGGRASGRNGGTRRSTQRDLKHLISLSATMYTALRKKYLQRARY